ncbi:holo-ACP synthase [Terriglobus sp.]|uniref:holo-ACP synthase n=1 Tax=Terriglobus sp. TaxID=1889013 RepID=UPI003B0090A2
MILGTGSDLMEIERIRQSLDRYGDRFLRRVYTPGEVDYCRRKVHNSAESFAARFAAKEAGAKALGTGIAQGVAWTEIEVRRAAGQRPTLHFTGRAAERAARMGVRQTHLTLSHSREVALAVVVLES